MTHTADKLDESMDIRCRMRDVTIDIVGRKLVARLTIDPIGDNGWVLHRPGEEYSYYLHEIVDAPEPVTTTIEMDAEYFNEIRVTLLSETVTIPADKWWVPE